MESHPPLCVNVDGGLGDHVSAEPAIRYLKKVYPGEICLVSYYPRVFSHLGLRHYTRGADSLPTAEEFQMMYTFPGAGPLADSVCHLVTHMTDFHAMALLRRTLPLEERTHRLAVGGEDRAELEKKLGGVDSSRLILLHASSGWRSKTFPREWWQAVADGLAARGAPLALIGKRVSDIAGDIAGLVEIACPAGALDLRDQLSLGGLFALMERAPVLLSNDSSPIQIAGAFENWVVLIASCKHPDLVLPYRRGTPRYKTKALSQRLVIDDAPFEPVRDREIRVDVPVADWSPYLPEPEEVVREILALGVQ